MSHATVPVATPAATPRSRASRGALIIYVLVLMFASLNPFVGWQLPQSLTLFHWPKYITNFDVAINVIAYLPLGALLLLSLQRRLRQWQVPSHRLVSWCSAVAGAFFLSVTLELLQAMLPWRVSSPLDVVANTLGAAIGATGLFMPLGRKIIDAVRSWRQQHFRHDPLVDWGLLLMVIWFVAQLNPAIPFFEAGLMAGPNSHVSYQQSSASAYDPPILLPQAIGKALNVTAFSLFVSLLLHRSKRVLLNIGLILTVGLLAKFAMAALLLKAPLITSSLSPSTVIGVIAGIAMYMLLAGVRFRWRAFWATLLVFTGGVMAKLSSVYSALGETLTLFSWPHGQMANFTNLTRWLNEIWPIAALIFLATIFIRADDSAGDTEPGKN